MTRDEALAECRRLADEHQDRTVGGARVARVSVLTPCARARSEITGRRSDSARAGYAQTMGYVLAGLLVLVIVAVVAALLTISSRRHGGRRRRAADDESYGAGLPGTEMAIVAAEDDAPLGDTREHAGRQRDGETVAGQDAAGSGGSRRAVQGGYAGTGGIGEPSSRRPERDSSSARPVVGGEGEGLRRRPTDG